MGSQKTGRFSSGVSLSLKTGNKLKRQALFIQQKKAVGKAKHEERHRRRREEAQDPEAKRKRLAANQPNSIDKKRVWDEGDEDSLYASIDVAQAKRRKLEAEEEAEFAKQNGAEESAEDDDDDVDSMLGSEDEDAEDKEDSEEETERQGRKRAQRDTSLAPSTTSTNLDLSSAALKAKFPNLFSDEPPAIPKILITTSLNSNLHAEAKIFESIFPNSNYIPRSGHRFARKYSVREISKFAHNREYTAVLVLKEDSKKLTGVTVVHLPAGPSLTYSISNFIPGSKLPGHGNPQDYYPELLLNGFSTSLGILTAGSLMHLFPPQPEIAGRQVLTLHNQRDYIFVRRHRYVYRDKKTTEKSVDGVDGKPIAGFEQIRVGLQELGPRFTMKLRRVDKGIGRAGSEGEDALQWEWKAKMEKKRTRFNL
ncbi:putative brix domain-containing protein [Phaeoacremonium minimum UCRPA7]|uniref:Putative brix domain-containing protein n=1 Tax=Phaeoacremonium minimum (strain UCR-PA7) TaxID=1286976 RepID=R8BTS9_PHAM7|nr:putative brix domain-containing protein [Phaeoacremonium minimum UCRPA7]EOO02793.1 putative brix domain-containing protein [Phaeoacremonium minimum UCRPA7]